MSTGITFDVISNKHLCSLNVSNDCLGYITIEDSYYDGEVAWDYCTPCAEHEQLAVKREEWSDKHARCDGCGQFLKKRVFIESTLFPELDLNKSPWISHYVQDYWGEWDHI